MVVSHRRKIIFILFAVVAVAISVLALFLAISKPEISITEYAYTTSSADAKSLTYIAKNCTFRIGSDRIELLSRGSGNGINGSFFNVKVLNDGNVTEFFSDMGHKGIIMREGGTVKELGEGRFEFVINGWVLHLLILKFSDKYPFALNINATDDDNLPLASTKLIIANASLDAFGYSKEFSPEVVREVIVYTTDGEGIAKDVFPFGSDVYCCAKGLLPDTSYKIWIQPDPLQEMETLSLDKDPSKTGEIYQTNEFGCFSVPILIWTNASSPSEYDVAIDRIGEKEGIYDALNDGIDSPVGAGFMVAPLPEEVQAYGVELRAYPEYKEVFPGVEANYFIEIRNTGKVNDTYDISCENIDNIDFIYIDKRQVSLKAGESAIVELVLRERDPDEYVVNVIAKSRANLDVTASVSISLKVKKTGRARKKTGGASIPKAIAPVVKLYDENGTAKEVFELDESVYFRAEGLPANKPVDIYVVPNREWKIGDPLGEDVSNDGINTVLTDGYGNLPPVEIWSPPLTVGKYDVVMDINQNGRLDEGEPVDDFTATAGFEVIPEFLTVSIPIIIILIIFFLFQRVKKWT